MNRWFTQSQHYFLLVPAKDATNAGTESPTGDVIVDQGALRGLNEIDWCKALVQDMLFTCTEVPISQMLGMEIAR